MHRNYQLPEGKKIHVYKSGDIHYTGASMVVNPRQIKTLDTFLSTVTTKVDPDWGAVRSIHTPQRGTVVGNLQSINREGVYVAAGPKGFVSIPGGYENIGKPGPRKKFLANHKPIHRPGLKNEVFNIKVYKNGDPLVAVPFKFSKSDFGNWDQALYRLSEKVRLSQGAVKRIYYLNGKIVKSPSDLVNNESYVVAASGENFREVGYGETDVDGHDTVPPRGSRLRWYKQQQQKRNQAKKSLDDTNSYSEHGSNYSRKSYPQRRPPKKKSATEDVPGNQSAQSSNLTQRRAGRLGGRGRNNNRKSDRRDGGDSKERESGRSKQGSIKKKSAPRVVSSKIQNKSRPSSRRSSAKDRTRSSESRSQQQTAQSRTSGAGTAEDQEAAQRNSRQRRGRRVPSAVTREIPKQIPENSDLDSVDYFKLRSRNTTPQQSPLSSPANSRPSSAQSYFDYTGRRNSLQEPIVEEGEMEEEVVEEDDEDEDDRESYDHLSTVEEESYRSMSRLSLIDSGHASLLSDEERPDSVFRAKTRSRPVTRAREVDYDTDDGGIFRAKSRADYSKNAKEILDSSVTEIELPVDLIDALEVQEEVSVA